MFYLIRERLRNNIQYVGEKSRRTSPNVVVAVSAKLTVTVPVPPPPPPGVPPEPSAPMWMAMALRAGTVAVNDPPETVNL
jgi:hypothetical protein